MTHPRLSGQSAPGWYSSFLFFSCADGQQQYPSESRPRRHCQCAQTLQSHRIHMTMYQANGMTHMTPAFSGNGYPTSSSETFELGMGGIAGAAGGSSPQVVMNSRAFSAAACSAAFLARAIAVKDVSSYPPCGVANAGIVRWHVNLGLAGGGDRLQSQRLGCLHAPAGFRTSLIAEGKDSRAVR